MFLKYIVLVCSDPWWPLENVQVLLHWLLFTGLEAVSTNFR